MTSVLIERILTQKGVSSDRQRELELAWSETGVGRFDQYLVKVGAISQSEGWIANAVLQGYMEESSAEVVIASVRSHLEPDSSTLDPVSDEPSVPESLAVAPVWTEVDLEPPAPAPDAGQTANVDWEEERLVLEGQVLEERQRRLDAERRLVQRNEEYSGLVETLRAQERLESVRAERLLALEEAQARATQRVAELEAELKRAEDRNMLLKEELSDTHGVLQRWAKERIYRQATSSR